MSPSDPKTTKETLELGNAENKRQHPEGKNKKLVLHGQGKLEVRRTRARHLGRADTGKANNQTKKLQQQFHSSKYYSCIDYKKIQCAQYLFLAKSPLQGIEQVPISSALRQKIGPHLVPLSPKMLGGPHFVTLQVLFLCKTHASVNPPFYEGLLFCQFLFSCFGP